MKEGWEIKTLGEICEIKGGSTPLKSNELFWTNGTVPWFTIEDIRLQGKDIVRTQKYITNLAAKRLTLYPKNTVLICCTASIGECAISKIELTSNQQFNGLMIKNGNEVYYKYLYYYATTLKRQLLELSGKATIDFVSVSKLKSIPIPIPPLTEQKRIVSILDKAFAAIDKAKANAEKSLSNAKELFESYLNGVFEGKSQGDNFQSLDELCELIVDCEHKTAPTQDEGYPSIRTPNIGKGELILDNVNRVSYETYIQWTRRATPKYGDLILAREAPAGNIAIIPENIDVCLGQRTVLLRPKKDKFIPKYLAYLILSKDVQTQLLSHSVGATVEHINMKDIRAFKIYNLSSISDQKKKILQIEYIQKETQALENNYSKKISNLAELKKSVLHKAFNGEI